MISLARRKLDFLFKSIFFNAVMNVHGLTTSGFSTNSRTCLTRKVENIWQGMVGKYQQQNWRNTTLQGLNYQLKYIGIPFRRWPFGFWQTSDWPSLQCWAIALVAYQQLVCPLPTWNKKGKKLQLNVIAAADDLLSKWIWPKRTRI